MYRILIAEDSKPILRNIKELLLTSELPVQVVHTASNGEDALEGFRSHFIDILITDIRMPKLDGLALIEEAKKTNPKLKVILISGYNDFEYTRKAINLQVVDYLLKPVERGALVEVMERVIGQIGEECREELAGLDVILEPAASRALTLHPEFFRNRKLVILLQLQYFHPEAPGWRTESIQNGLSRSFAPYPFRVFATNKRRQMLVLTEPSFIGGSGSTMERLADVRACLIEAGLSVSIAGCFRPLMPKDIADCCQTLSEFISSRISILEPVLADTDHPASQIIEAGEDMERIGSRYCDMILKLQKEPFLRQLGEQLSKWGRSNLRIVQLRRFVAMLVNAFALHLPVRDEKNDWEIQAEAQHLFERTSYGEFCSGLLTLFESRFSLVQSLNKKSGYELFRLIDVHLQSNLYSQVSMNDLAASFHVSPSYISRVVKKHSQRTLMQYYLNLKIGEARKAMESNPSLKIKELSDALCFYDQHYFSKVFKEYAGCSPSEYKRMLHGKES
ncbi:response regulator transcription factor [Paenibacillus harenae]|uniref:response regulator transcription factor n=1 Tax=Paenibacillus harenae TaxID=306543 RepID=UPI00042A17CA|nr:response regulator [Paenibacillus harenae]